VAPPQVGQTFGRYEIQEEVAQGGMGVVYKARDSELGRVVALKMLQAGVLARPDEVERFHREARAAAQLRHPHIVPILDIGQVGPLHYFTMTFAPGGSLSRHMERFADPPRAALLVEKVARAVHHAHANGVLHRDLKPGNVLLDEADEPLVGDFGLAKLLDSNVELTQAGQLIGTPAYMAPEQAGGRQGQVTAGADVWSLGVLLYELLTGQRPFPGGGREATIHLILTATPAAPRSLNPALDPVLEAVVLKCLEKDLGRRYASAGALADDLANWRGGQQTVARPPRWPRRAWKAVRRHPRWGTAAALLLLGLGAVAAYHVLPPPPEKNKPAPTAPISFLDGKGRLRLHRWVVGKGELTTIQGKEIRLESKDTLSLVEFVKKAPWERYRFEAQVRDRSRTTLEVGIYVGYSKKVFGKRVAHWFGELSYADNPRAPRPQFNLVRYLSPGGQLDLVSPGFDIPIKPVWGKWRSLALEVTPTRIFASWDDLSCHLPGGIDPDTLIKRVSVPWRNPVGQGIHFRPRGGLGIFCYRGSASFRQVIVRPVDDRK
jgi:serine/threonine protein kinase